MTVTGMCWTESPVPPVRPDLIMSLVVIAETKQRPRTQLEKVIFQSVGFLLCLLVLGVLPRHVVSLYHDFSLYFPPDQLRAVFIVKEITDSVGRVIKFHYEEGEDLKQLTSVTVEGTLPQRSLRPDH